MGSRAAHLNAVLAAQEEPLFQTGDTVRVLTRSPIGHYRVPAYLRGKRGRIERIITPRGIDNEEEAYGRNAGSKRYYYRIAVPMTEIWPDYAGPSHDSLRIEVFETWLARG
jgi:nitrile hydratase